MLFLEWVVIMWVGGGYGGFEEIDFWAVDDVGIVIEVDGMMTVSGEGDTDGGGVMFGKDVSGVVWVLLGTCDTVREKVANCRLREHQFSINSCEIEAEALEFVEKRYESSTNLNVEMSKLYFRWNRDIDKHVELVNIRQTQVLERWANLWGE